MATVGPTAAVAPRPAVPRSLFVRAVFKSELAPAARLVLLAVAWSAGRSGRGSYLSMAAISERTGYSRERVNRLLIDCKRAGWLAAEPRAGRTNDWVLTVPAAEISAELGPSSALWTELSEGAARASGALAGEGGPPHGRGGPPSRARGVGRTQEELITHPRPARLPWCGLCDEKTRLQDLDDGSVRRCRKCHGKADTGSAGGSTRKGPRGRDVVSMSSHTGLS